MKREFDGSSPGGIVIRILFLCLMCFFAARASADDSDWQKQWWIGKTVRLLRGGKGLDSSDNMSDLMKMSEPDIINKLMSDSRMGNMVLDFNMYFLGYRLDSLWYGNGTYTYMVYDFPSAIESARQVNAGGDYFTLFDLSAPAYLGHAYGIRGPGDNGKSDFQVNQENVQGFQAAIQAVLTEAQAQQTTATPATVCQGAAAQFQTNGSNWLNIGVPAVYYSDILVNNSPIATLRSLCGNPAKLTLPQTIQALQNAFTFAMGFLNRYQYASAPTYTPALIEDIIRIEPDSIGSKGKLIQWGNTQRQSLTNSSTNMDRKRGAYMLQRFFCDNLTPVGTETPAQHTGDPHGSDPRCISCHYKLDPMAGFFRMRGGYFYDYTTSKTIRFDDKATAKLADYVQAWASPPGIPVPWNVGYIRSIEHPRLNSYGDTLSDLHALLRTAPEVKSCLIRRLFEYVVDPNQTIDGGYLNYLTQEFNKRATDNSSTAFKWVVTQLVMSQSYAQMNPDPSRCYDYAPGTQPTAGPPCRVAYLLKQNCTACHGGDSAPKNLFLDQWVALPGGGFNFKHLDENGNQRSLKDTMTVMADRLTTSDDTQRMPPMQFMSSQDRQDLYTWVESQ